MPGVYDGAEVLVWVNMAEPKAAQSTIGTGNAAYLVKSNITGTAGNSIQFSQAAPSASPGVSVSLSGSNIVIAVSPLTGALANDVIAQINSAPAAKYYVTASRAPSSDGTGSIPAPAVTVGQLGVVGTAGAGTFVGAVAGAASFSPVSRQQGVDYDDSMDTIDAVSKGDRFALQLAGRQSGSFELSGLHSYEDDTQERIRRAYQNREELLFRRILPPTITSSGSTIAHEAKCRVTGFSISHPDSDVATFSAPITLQENWRVV